MTAKISLKYTECTYGFIFNKDHTAISLDDGATWIFSPVTQEEYDEIFSDCMFFATDCNYENPEDRPEWLTKEKIEELEENLEGLLSELEIVPKP